MSPAHAENWPVTVIKGGVDEQLLRDIRTLLSAAEESDGNPSISEQTLVTLRAADT
ncbi:MAG TPA: mycothiol synthase, partial [Arthrobacter sp.]|nr:mycothiol synthase [Arthrobacter sp.]